VPAGTAADALQTTRQEPVDWVCPLEVGRNGGEAPRLATRRLGLLRTWAKDIGLKPLDPIASNWIWMSVHSHVQFSASESLLSV
jgi:hypothetical protein